MYLSFTVITPSILPALGWLCWLAYVYMYVKVTRGAHENMPSLSLPRKHYVSVYMCLCLAVGPVEKSSHIKLMDEIPPWGNPGYLFYFPACY